MKKTIVGLAFTAILLSNTIAVHAKDTATVYGVHDPVDANLGGLEWIFILASFVFLTGQVLIVNGKTLNNRIEK